MMISESLEVGKVETLLEVAQRLEEFTREAARLGLSLHEVEQKTLGALLLMGKLNVDQFLQAQGNGDLGETVTTTATTTEGRTLRRSPEMVERPLRTVFGEHSFAQFVYAVGPKRKIELRPIDARLGLPEGKYSYLLEEFSQFFCIEQAFDQASLAFQKVFGQRLPVDSLERINRRVGAAAEQYLDQLPRPPKKEEGELLVSTSDAKGVPLIRDDAESIPAFCARERPGNRRMATLAAVYSVDRHVRSPEEIVAALFRDPRDETASRPKRPEPAHKHVVARFAETVLDGDRAVPIPAPFVAWTWGAAEIRRRRQPGQPLLRMCDGQETLWDAAVCCAEPADADAIEILDLLHVSSYVWSAARAFHPRDEAAARQFTRERLLRLLRGEVSGVIRGLRQMATQQHLRGTARKSVQTAATYFDKNSHRMRYDESLAAGYPIATGVIEGACLHLVKDRMERSGMRWRLTGASPMLAVRALRISHVWDAFQKHQQQSDLDRLHPHRQLLKNYTPKIIAF